jgi:flavodoxin
MPYCPSYRAISQEEDMLKPTARSGDINPPKTMPINSHRQVFLIEFIRLQVLKFSIFSAHQNQVSHNHGPYGAGRGVKSDDCRVHKFLKETNSMKFELLLIAIALMLATVGTSPALAAPSQTGGKILVAYFSWGGNTRLIANQIHQSVGGDIFEIKTVTPYPTQYTPTTEVAKREQQADARPILAARVNNMDSYDVIFLGYPNWWGTIPMALFTFLEQYDFSGKTIIPFCTHEGSALGRSVSDITKLAPQATVLEGLAVRGGRVGGDSARDAVTQWLNRLDIGKSS